MLTRTPPRPHGQRGVTLFITLISLVVMTLAAVALMRSVDTNTLIAGNLAFRQSGVQSGDQGIEAAIQWLAGASSTTLAANSSTNGYFASDPCPANPSLCQDEATFYEDRFTGGEMKQLTTDSSTGNQVSYVIHRLCANAGSATATATSCVTATGGSGSGNSQAIGSPQLNAASQVYYRITTRVAGPRNTVSYTQAVIIM